jgi:dTDP-4-amino-4,6-dideoxygalactose transaminase
MMALKELKGSGEVIVPPLTWVSDVASIIKSGLTPVFVDIDPNTLNIDPLKIEGAITPATTAIMAVHVYGQRCDVHAIKGIADKYNLKVIYDAAHAFGIRDEGGSILRHGDLSVLSFHATKVFNTFEGGAIIAPDTNTKKRIDYLKNFGFADEVTVVATGINGKMNEFSAALGVLQLRYIDQALARRRDIAKMYRERLSSIPGIRILLEEPEGQETNFSYYPIMIRPPYHSSRDQLYHRLKENAVHARRYFYPLITDFPMYRTLPSVMNNDLSVAREASNTVLCLPMYPDLTGDQVEYICDQIKAS